MSKNKKSIISRIVGWLLMFSIMYIMYIILNNPSLEPIEAVASRWNIQTLKLMIISSMAIFAIVLVSLYFILK